HPHKLHVECTTASQHHIALCTRRSNRPLKMAVLPSRDILERGHENELPWNSSTHQLPDDAANDVARVARLEGVASQQVQRFRHDVPARLCSFRLFRTSPPRARCGDGSDPVSVQLLT